MRRGVKRYLVYILKCNQNFTELSKWIHSAFDFETSTADNAVYQRFRSCSLV